LPESGDEPGLPVVLPVGACRQSARSFKLFGEPARAVPRQRCLSPCVRDRSRGERGLPKTPGTFRILLNSTAVTAGINRP
jgi:hypothetical protein